MKKRQVIMAVVLAGLLAATVLLAGCDKREDTRQYVHTIGIVVTNDVDQIFDEMYVYPDGDLHEMGRDCIQNAGGIKRIGSYGATVEESAAYGMTVRDNRGGVYMFETLALYNADHLIISFDEDGILMVTIRHEDGTTETRTGAYVHPGDALSQPYNPLKEQVAYQFTVQNDSGRNLTFMAMREAEAQSKGEVELYLDELKAGSSTVIQGRLYKEDQEITEWVLYMETDDGEVAVSKTTFDPWTAETVVITSDGALLDIAPA
ncbi:MAG: hypothetical protein GXY32_06000 [Ruminococcaceae bacterium]|nr:hypothetical protein [Oscillospiraceae bacterium]